MWSIGGTSLELQRVGTSDSDSGLGLGNKWVEWMRMNLIILEQRCKNPSESCRYVWLVKKEGQFHDNIASLGHFIWGNLIPLLWSQSRQTWGNLYIYYTIAFIFTTFWNIRERLMSKRGNSLLSKIPGLNWKRIMKTPRFASKQMRKCTTSGEQNLKMPSKWRRKRKKGKVFIRWWFGR